MHHTDLDLALLNPWQRDFPLQRQPFAIIGQGLGLDGATVLQHYARLQRQGSLSRIGAVFAPGAGGASLLAAMAVPPQRLEAVAAIVSSHPGVNHNYEREHATNLWFVATGRDEAQVEQLLRSIEAETGLPVLRLPMLRPYRIDTGFDLRASQSRASGTTHWTQAPLQEHDKPLAALAEQGLALVDKPYDLWAAQLHTGVDEVLAQLQLWLQHKTLSRFGVVVRHHELGYTANAMTVFDVPESEVDACGEALAQTPGVTLAYQRARTGGWPYNLYCMVHGRDRDSVRATVAQAVARAGLAHRPHAMLFSLRRFKQTGARRFAAHAAHHHTAHHPNHQAPHAQS
ncbi:MAG: Lrp/AsnC family transcriptional regulator [Proteobacteria bacterium]|nr:Lrp/AsnC family transcriptional regulator [Pseudomonadota bacterium]